MCLISKQKEHLIAKEDIVVYKVFTKDDKSPYQEFDYTPYIGKLLTDTAPEDVVPIKDFNGNCIETEVFGGFVHSYAKLRKAEQMASLYGGRKVRKCIIPKGTRIFISEFGSQIASKSIIIGEKVYVSNMQE